jgi:hypothetical protein
MSKTTVVGSSPISFTDAGQSFLIPLSVLIFDEQKVIKFKDNTYSADVQKKVLPWIYYLVKIGELTPGEKPVSNPAIEIAAKNAGKAGNNIQIKFQDIKEIDSTFTAVITATEIYKLSFKKSSVIFIEKVLGDDKLVHVKGAGTATETAPKDNKSYKLENGDDTSKSFKSIEAEPSGTAFIIEAKKNGEDGKNITIDISDVNTTDQTYTLTATWNPTFKDIKLGDLPGKLQGFQDVITVTKPTASEFAVPDAGVVFLNGGADKQDAVPAKTTALATAFIS